MQFSEALKLTQETGIGIYRKSWPGCDDHAARGIARFVELKSENSPLLREGPSIDRPIWVATGEDLVADDWMSL